MVESSRLVFKLLCVKLKSLNFDFIMDTTTQFNLHHNNMYSFKAIPDNIRLFFAEAPTLLLVIMPLTSNAMRNPSHHDNLSV